MLVLFVLVVLLLVIMPALLYLVGWGVMRVVKAPSSVDRSVTHKADKPDRPRPRVYP